MTWERQYFGHRLQGFDQPITWLDLVQLGAPDLLFTLSVVYVVWRVVKSAQRRQMPGGESQVEQQVQRFLTMLAGIRLMLSVWTVRPRA